MAELWSSWEDSGSYLELGPHRVFYRDTGTGKEDNRPVLLILHGFPTSSWDFHLCLEHFRDFRVILHDHPGFGLSSKIEDYSYSLLEQAEVALALWQALGISEGHLLAHDYGTSVATEILARREKGWAPVRLQSLTLCNGSARIELARLRPIQQLLKHPWTGHIVARLATFQTFRRNMRAIWGEASKLDDQELRAHWNLMERDGGRLRLPIIARYNDERHKFWNRWIGALKRFDLPAHVLWADLDPIAHPAIAEALHKDIPGSQLSWLKGVGHYPMLEEPQRWSEAALDFYHSL